MSTAAWWLRELEAIVTSRGVGVTEDMKRASYIALKVASGERWDDDRGWIATTASWDRPEPSPIDMVLHCPSCGLQHIDTASDAWANPSHRSHLCGRCQHVWRPADVFTNGVAAITSRGKADSPGLPEQDITGPLTDAQRRHACELYANLHHLGRDAADDLILYVAVAAYVNGARDCKGGD